MSEKKIDWLALKKRFQWLIIGMGVTKLKFFDCSQKGATF
jgi:hypothetical protein